MQVTSDQKSFFEKNGYLIIDNFYSKTELNDFTLAYADIIRSTVERIYSETAKRITVPQELGAIFDQTLFEIESVDHKYVAQIYDTTAQIPEFLRIISKKETSDVINGLLEKESSNPLYTYTCRCRIDMPSDTRRTYGWHQEVFYTIPKSNFLQTWAPLIRNTTIQNGTIEVCPGSQKEGIADQSWNEIPGRATQIIVEDRLVEKYPQISCEMQLGQLLIFSSRLFHRSGQNSSKETRFSLVGMYHDISNPTFYAPEIAFKHGVSPREFYEEVFTAQKLTKSV